MNNDILLINKLFYSSFGKKEKGIKIFKNAHKLDLKWDIAQW